MNLREPFMEKDAAKVQAFLCSVPFALFISADENGEPVASHLPVDFDASRGRHGTLVAHIANANPHTRLMAEAKPVLAVFTGADAYISPSWFVNRASAPTQAHITVHCYGRPKLITEVENIRAVMERQVASRERRRPQAWSTEELGEAGYLRRLKSISGIEMEIDRVLASFRLLQDEDTANIAPAVERLEAGGEAPLARCIRAANAERMP